MIFTAKHTNTWYKVWSFINCNFVTKQRKNMFQLVEHAPLNYIYTHLWSKYLLMIATISLIVSIREERCMASAYIDPCVVVPPQTTLDPYEITTGTQQVTSLTHTIRDAHTLATHITRFGCQAVPLSRIIVLIRSMSPRQTTPGPHNGNWIIIYIYLQDRTAKIVHMCDMCDVDSNVSWYDSWSSHPYHP